MTDLAKAIELVRALKFGTVPSGADLVAIDMICDAAERASRVSVEDVRRIFVTKLQPWCSCGGRAGDVTITTVTKESVDEAVAAVMALLRGEG